MSVVGDLSFKDYVRMGDETTAALGRNSSPFLEAIEEYHSFFATSIWTVPASGHPLANLLGMNSFMLLLAGARIAMTGHPAAVFPVLRTALESACYAFLISQDHALSDVWLGRNGPGNAKAKSRAAFSAPVQKTVAALNTDDDEKSADWILEAYEASIDFGAHPNPRSVLPYLTMPNKNDSPHREINLSSLYGAKSFETHRSLVAVLDYGLAIAVVLVNALPADADAVTPQLEALNATKERVTQWVNEA